MPDYQLLASVSEALSAVVATGTICEWVYKAYRAEPSGSPPQPLRRQPARIAAAAPDDLIHLFFRFRGRTPRMQFWFGFLVMAAVSVAVVLILRIFAVERPVNAPAEGPGWPGAVAFLIVLGPLLAVLVKRLHDRNKSGLWLTLIVVPLGLQGAAIQKNPNGLESIDERMLMLGVISLFLMMVWLVVELGGLRGTAGDNRYGPDPLTGA